ncbi:MAG: response regulator transcription factor [Acidobacteria bacterium]|nr:response regulator transcription factor [Acidobacteriota bacterium]
MINVVIADDHTMVRHGLREILKAESDIRTVAEASTGQEAIDIIRSRSVDVLLLDITMPGRNGLEVLKELRRSHPRIAVIMLSMHPKDQYGVRVIKAGAAAYISKESAPDELVSAIRTAHRGEKYITPDLAELLARHLERGLVGDEPHKLLSDREYEVMCYIASGRGLTEISKLMNLSVKTISTYRTRIVEKTGLTSNADMTRYAMQHSLI